MRVLEHWLHLHSFLRYLQVSGSKRLVSRMAAPTPNPGCMVCGTAQAGLSVDTRKMTLQQLVDKVGRLQGNAWARPLLHVTDRQWRIWPVWLLLCKHVSLLSGPSPPVPPCAALSQVLKGRLALLAPSLSCGSFLYEEGQDLEDDEVGMRCLS